MAQAIVFDLDGTLIYTLPSLALSGNEMLRHYALAEVDLDLYQQFVGNGSRLLVRRLLDKRGASETISEDEALRVYLDAYERNCLRNIEAYRGLIELCHKFKERGFKLGILTNKPHDQAIRVTESIYGPDTFDFILGQKPQAKVKPDPGLIADFKASFPFEAASSYFVGDSSVDINTGKIAGMHTVGVLWGYRDKEELVQNGADYIATEISDLARIILGEN